MRTLWAADDMETDHGKRKRFYAVSGLCGMIQVFELEQRGRTRIGPLLETLAAKVVLSLRADRAQHP